MTYISGLDHNPDFPFAAVGQSGVVYALFAHEEEADEFLETSSTGASKVIDTSPKPKREPTDGSVWRQNTLRLCFACLCGVELQRVQ